MHIHLIAIGGTGMAPLACLLQRAGHTITGSDGELYPPMSTLLESAGIEPFVGFDPAHLEPPPELVIVGNAVPRDNPEALASEHRALPRISMPQALSRFFLAGRRPLVVAGTHGKTTTTSLAAWVYTACGRDPGYLIGGVPLDLEASFRRGGGERFVIEGDEYNAAYFDRGPKFLHYQPETLILTGVEHDHADLYPDAESLLAAYRKLVTILPADGLIVACGDHAQVREVVSGARCPVLFYGLGADNDVRPAAIETAAGRTRFRVVAPPAAAEGAAEATVELRLAGDHNVSNALAVWTAARRDGIPVADISAALGRFSGVRRRMEELGTWGGVTVIDDFAHHPTAVAASLQGLRARYPERRLVAVFEPRSLTAGRDVFFDAYLEALGDADAAYVAPVFHAGRLAPAERLDPAALCERLTATGTPAATADSVEELLERVGGEARPGDVVATMSSGHFGGFPHRLAGRLRETG